MTHLIDGHNFIGSGLAPGIRLDDPDDEARLLQWLRAGRGRAGGPDMIVFFDSGDAALLAPLPGPGRSAISGTGVDARYSRPGEQADDVIVAFLERQKQPGQFTVVTNDGELTMRVRFAGANVVTVAHFVARLLPPAARKPRPPAADADRATPSAADPAFADIRAAFLAAEKAAGRGRRASETDFAVWVERLLGAEPQQAQQAAAWLGRSGAPAALEPLRAALWHDDAGVRAAAALALGVLGDRAAIPDLSERLAKDDNSMVREAAAQTLGLIGDRRAEAALEAAMKSDRKSKVRKSAGAALAQLRARRG